MHYIALTGGGMLVVGCLLPWILLGTVFVQRTLDTVFGTVALLSGLLATGIAIHNIVKKQNRMQYAYLPIGGICLMIGLYGLLHVRDLRTAAEFANVRQTAEGAMPGAAGITIAGLWSVTIGGFILSGTGLVNVFSQRIQRLEKAVSDRDGGAGAPPTSGVRAKGGFSLNGIAGAYAGQQIPIPPEGITIGRDPACSNLVIQSPSVSRRHARILQGPSPDSCTLEDLNSTNGTFVLERNAWVRLTEPVALTIFKRFRLGDEQTEFEIR